MHVRKMSMDLLIQDQESRGAGPDSFKHITRRNFCRASACCRRDIVLQFLSLRHAVLLYRNESIYRQNFFDHLVGTSF